MLVFLGAPSALAVSEFRTATSVSVAQIYCARQVGHDIAGADPFVLLYHGIGTPSPVTGSVGNYNVTLRNFKANMAALAKAGYATVTPRQYVAWLSGINLRLPAKPVLITFDDAFWSDTFATPIMARYGFHAVMFVVTGYADQLYGTEYAPWTIVSAMSKEGWYLQLHAGECGHAFLPDAPAACLKGLDRTQVTTSQYEDYIWNFGQTDAQYETRVVKDIKNGLADLASHAGFVKGWRSQLSRCAASAPGATERTHGWIATGTLSVRCDLHTADHDSGPGGCEGVPRPLSPGTRGRSPERALPHE